MDNNSVNNKPEINKHAWSLPASIIKKINNFSEKHSFNPLHFKIGLILFACLLILLIFLGMSPKVTVSSKATALGLKNIGELATQEGYFTSVQTISQSRNIFGIEVPLTQSNYVFSYDGLIKAGIDFEKINVDVDDTSHEITIELPEVKLLSIEIDETSFKLYNDGENIFTPLRMEDINAALTDLKTTIKDTAIANGILENAYTNAKLLVSAFLPGCYDMTSYTLIFK